MTTIKPNKKGLDLGLSSLMKEEDSFNSAKTQLVDEPTPPKKTEPPNFSQLADRGAWRELMTLSEQWMDREGEFRLEAKLWWTRAQVELGLIPINVLAAPIESITREVVEALQSEHSLPEEHRAIAEHTLVKAAHLLGGSREHDLALKFMERAYTLRSLRSGGGRNRGDSKEISAVSPRVSKSKGVTPVLWVSLVAAAFALGLFSWFVSPHLVTPKLTPSFGWSFSPKSAGLVIPVSERLPVFSRLDPILYGYEKNLGTVSSPLANPEQRTPPKAEGALESVNTSGPIEEIDLANIKEEPPPQPPRPALFPQDKPKLVMGEPDAVPEEMFHSLQTYLVVAPTKVMARPSSFTVPIAELESGDRVMVEAKVGKWLKVRSKQGQVGYIRSQDARKTET